MLKSVVITTLLVIQLLIPAAAKQSGGAPTVEEVWVKTTTPGGRVTGAYMRIKSATPMTLRSVESPVAEAVELHDMKMNDGVMEMRALERIEIPANKAIELKPGGMHVMLFKVKQPIKKGDKVALKLTFERADRTPLTVRVDAIGREAGAAGHSH